MYVHPANRWVACGGRTPALPTGAKRTGHRAYCARNHQRIDCRPAAADLEVQVRRHLRIRGTDCSDHLAFAYARAFGDVHSTQRAVHRIVATAVLDDDGVAVSTHHFGQHDRPGRHSANGRSVCSGYADAIPTRRRVVWINDSSKLIDDHALHGPGETTDISCADAARRTSRAAASGRCLQVCDEIVEATLRARERFQPSPCSGRIGLHSTQRLLLALLQ
jgi:hypothetical protein